MLTEASKDEKTSIAKALVDEEIDNLDSFSTFFGFYNSITRPRAHYYAILYVHYPALRSHEDILLILCDLKANHHTTYLEFKQRLRARWQAALDNEVDHAINIAVHLMVMIDCTIVDSHSEGYEIDGYRPSKWQSNERFIDFVHNAFPVDTEADRLQILEVQKNCNMLKAWKLKERAHVILSQRMISESISYMIHGKTLSGYFDTLLFSKPSYGGPWLNRHRMKRELPSHVR
jgi:hypothetical protein